MAVPGHINIPASAMFEVSMTIETSTLEETNIRVGVKARDGSSMWSASVNVDVSHQEEFSQETRGHAWYQPPRDQTGAYAAAAAYRTATHRG
jgi:hypothetical protein